MAESEVSSAKTVTIPIWVLAAVFPIVGLGPLAVNKVSPQARADAYTQTKADAQVRLYEAVHSNMFHRLKVLETRLQELSRSVTVHHENSRAYIEQIKQIEREVARLRANK